jgi:hypothetical protein
VVKSSSGLDYVLVNSICRQELDGSWVLDLDDPFVVYTELAEFVGSPSEETALRRDKSGK